MLMKPIATTRSATGVPTGRLAVWWLLASEVVIFGGLLGSYLMMRLGHPEWADAAMHTNTWIGATNTFVLLTSSFTAVLAHQAAEKGDGKKAAGLLVLTIGGALTFLAIKSFEWYTEISHGYTITANNFWSFYYTAAGLHALHVIAGAIIMGFIAWDAFRGKELQRVELIGIYWHFVDVVWIFLFPLLYIAK
ncbi:MAG: cytochrome oxidase subunit III [Gemmatimonadales bacterium]|nr:cytochrome oxidase subunit III [Gemmatimonadales bacterium]MBT3499200.1 cytochrome oxidase subunit III [Gemmatimonadales bacterium]MBT3773817.1 cytochrome oxidase subunit III [Gemmatimonadales bacterium]MBT3959753.1 cytochrome oxidase subunit III [Gemmatimonadales bacterium]MBT4185804.1 cytochrome oxidase subunit III [Gemmatimonadales bacterium]